jgi:hypothetical protein
MSGPSDSMREALTTALKAPLRRLHDHPENKPPWPAHHTTLRSLVLRGLLEHSEHRTRRGWLLEEWAITDAGREALEPVQITRRPSPRFMARSGGIRYKKLAPVKPGDLGRWVIDEAEHEGDYTSDPRRSIDTDGGRAVEVVTDAATIEGFAKRAEQRQQKRLRQSGKALDDETAEVRLERIRLVARSKHMHFNREDRLLRHLLDHGRRKAAEDRLRQLETQLGQRVA